MALKLARDADRFKILESSLPPEPCPPYRAAERELYHGSNAHLRGILDSGIGPQAQLLPLDPAI